MKFKIKMTPELSKALMEALIDSPDPSLEVGKDYEIKIYPATEESEDVAEKTSSDDEATTDGDVDVVGGGTKPPRP